MAIYELTPQQMGDAQRAFDLAAMNGVLALASGLRGRGLLSDAQVETLHSTISAPLSVETVADNPVVQHFQAYIDSTFATLLNTKG